MPHRKIDNALTLLVIVAALVFYTMAFVSVAKHMHDMSYKKGFVIGLLTKGLYEEQRYQ